MRTIYDYLENDFGATEVAPSLLLSEKMLNDFIRLIDAGYNESTEPVLKEDLRCFVVSKCEKTIEFYNELVDLSLSGNEHQENLYLIYDEKHGYMYSNSNRFFLLMTLLQGIKSEEAKNNPYIILDYVQKVRSYLGFEI